MNKEALKKYGRHYEDCHLEKNALIKPYVCTCGFSEALLRAEEPKCKTCGGSGKMIAPRCELDVSKWREYPCPDCKPEEPPQGDYMQEWQDWMNAPLGKPNSKALDFEKARFKMMRTKVIKQAAELKELKEKQDAEQSPRSA